MRKISVFGFGAVGRETAGLLAKRGDAVRIVQRAQPTYLPGGCTFQAADSLDRDSAIHACAGVDTVVCAVGLKYRSAVFEHDWPIIMANLIDGCAASGARLVFADNLYAYGPQTRPLKEDMPLTDFGRKPKARAHVTRLWQEAHAAGKLRATAVRAADFYGPDVATSVISAYGVARLVAGQPALVATSLDHPHDFTFVPDFARALVSLVDAPNDAYGQAWHVPNAPTRTLREVLTLAASIIGVAPRISVLPPLLMPLIGLFVPDVAELAEMRFQWDRPYQVDASKFAARFWNDPTPFDDGLRETVAFYRSAASSS